MKKLLLLLVLGAAYWHWRGGQLPFVGAPTLVDKAGNPAVWIFTFEGCGDACDGAVRELRSRQVPFVHKSINPDNSDDENVKLWGKFSSSSTFPVIVMGSNVITGFYKPGVVTGLGKTFGNKYLTVTEQRYFKNHFNADGSPRIVLYGTDWCPYCAQLRKDFRANRVDFVDIDVEKSGEERLMSETMGINGYPIVWIGYSRVAGSDYAAVKAALASN